MDRVEVSDFYPSSCVPLTRRGFLSLAAKGLGAAAGLSLAWPGNVSAAKVEQWTETGMRGLIDRHAVAREDPWRILHAIRGRGKEFTLSGGESAVRYVLSTYPAEQEINGKRVLYFPIAVEAHTNLFLNNLLEAGASRSFAFEAHGRRYTLEALIDGAKARFDLAKVHPNDIAWSLVSLTTAVSPVVGKWVNAEGRSVEVSEFVERAFQIAEKATEEVRRAWMQNQPLAGKSAIHDFTCGGTHLIYSLVVAVRNGYQVRNGEQRLRDQLGMLVYRMWADLDLMDRFYAKVPDPSRPPAWWFKLDAKWKLLGHAFEVYHYALAHRLVHPTPVETKVVEAARPVLRHLAQEVEKVDLEAVRGHNLDLFRQLVGDTCHAYRGVHLA
ncbi:MAG: hypothetical protein HYS14_08910 [Candidatus Rokubacteria bacterium]|nr:hypothetical protein [Candidatus Rokubacteria bacterium]